MDNKRKNDGGVVELCKRLKSSTVLYRPPIYLDTRIFPDGLHRGAMVHMKGPLGAGQSIMATYLISRALFQLPLKKVILVDTSHKFVVRNLLAMLMYWITNKPFEDNRLSHSQLIELYPDLKAFLNRLFVIECWDAKQFLQVACDPVNSILNTTVNRDRDIGLVVVDTVDKFSFCVKKDPTLDFDVLEKLKGIC